jgi:tRNA-dihydrouridine synthase B
MKIGNVPIATQVLLAPLAGFTNSSFRLLCKEAGAGLVFTEFVSSEGIIRESAKTFDYLKFTDIERPLGIQLFGHKPESMAAAAKIIEERYQPDIIDLNFGCSVRKVVKKNAGAALLKDLPLLGSIANSVVKAVNTPVTAKIRLGWNHRSIVVTEVAQILEKSGIKALTVHPRTASDGYGNSAKWEYITAVKKALTIPVIGNGDIYTAEDAIRMFIATACDAVMIGRAAIGNPWIFNQVNSLLNHQSDYYRPNLADRIKMCIRQIELERKHADDNHVNRIMKKYYGSYVRGFSHASEIRNQLMQMKSLEKTILLLKSIQNQTISETLY